ncbi:E3 ubiquitin-protein ligase TRIM15-like [Pleurodeles waltl]|uniref:E3 ubiquitin-protein ligase TRIM15-like n=1 Tax=Pleurodeles waltl TaxID=8319 RepID=UPI0037099582
MLRRHAGEELFRLVGAFAGVQSGRPNTGVSLLPQNLPPPPSPNYWQGTPNHPVCAAVLLQSRRLNFNCMEEKNKVRGEKQKIESEIEQLRQLLRDKEQTLYRELEELEKKITMVENASISKLSKQITSLNVLIADLEKKCKEPALDLLKDVRSTLDRCKKVKFQGPESEMKKTREKEVIITLKPEEEMKKYKDSRGTSTWRRAEEKCCPGL